jgi:pyrroloquinoline quinone biosynthesis protein B
MSAILANRRFLAALFLLALGLLLIAFWWMQRSDPNAPYIAVLGTAQDGGHPHIGCVKECCRDASENEREHLVSCIALVDPGSGRRWIFDATPDFPEQLRRLDGLAPALRDPATRDIGVDGVFLTHAHMGHYTGLMFLGREAHGANGLPVYAMPRMREFLRGNGPWDQLIALQNIEVLALEADREVELGGELSVTPWLVPHRDEYTETVGFLIESKKSKALFLPDIDKWDRWERSLGEVLKDIDYAFIDATFFSADELPGRSLEEIPHPTITETIALLEGLSERQREKVHFIHLNHSNPAFGKKSPERGIIKAAGMNVAEEGGVYRLD